MMKIKEEIEKHQAAIKEHQKAIFELKKSCQHCFQPLTSKQIEDRWLSISAYCLNCGQNFGWRCKESPDQVCHYIDYYNNEGQIELIDGTFVSIPKDYDIEFPDGDCCVFCDLPDERK